jgi:membrane-bound lytic murein transglycosylase D
MAFRQFPGLVGAVIVTAATALLVGCSAGKAPTQGFQPSEPPKALSPPESPTDITEVFQPQPQLPPPDEILTPDPPPPSPLGLAMVRADSYYERGIQAMKNGDTDQAEWEFDAALETLLDNGPGPAVSPRLTGTHRSSPPSLSAWLSPPANRPRAPAAAPATEPPLADPDEPTQEAPALLEPEDAETLDKETQDGAAALPEPDTDKYEFPIVFNDQVRMFLQSFHTKKWGVVSRSFERARRYLPMMRQVFREKGLPEELINLAFIESAVNPWATSRVKAAGIWQFMAPTARLYGMQVTWWVDERRDPEKATRGAADYLKFLYGMFESWELALAAYNAGEGTVQRAIEKQSTSDFWKLRLPRETRAFVPAFMAMAIISKEPERFGFSPPPDEPFAAETVELKHPADFHTLARAAGTTVEHLRELNPALIRYSTPPGHSAFRVRIPAESVPDFAQNLERIPPPQRVGWIAHRVRKGETVPAIAKRYGASQKIVLEMNGLKRRQPLTPGKTLLVPASAAVIAMAAAEDNANRPGAKPAGAKTARHTVKKGETVAQIARAYGVPADDLRRWNRLSRTASVRAGQTLTVFVTPSQTARKNIANSVAPPLSAAPSERRYTVKRGDTLAAIARTHRVSLDDLRRWNGLERDALLWPGQELRILASPS